MNFVRSLECVAKSISLDEIIHQLAAAKESIPDKTAANDTTSTTEASDGKVENNGGDKMGNNESAIEKEPAKYSYSASVIVPPTTWVLNRRDFGADPEFLKESEHEDDRLPRLCRVMDKHGKLYTAFGPYPNSNLSMCQRSFYFEAGTDANAKAEAHAECFTEDGNPNLPSSHGYLS